MQSFDEKLNLEVSIPRKLYDEWEPTIKIKIKLLEICPRGNNKSVIIIFLCCNPC